VSAHLIKLHKKNFRLPAHRFLSCIYTSAEKSTEFKLIMLVRVALYSQTETR